MADLDEVSPPEQADPDEVLLPKGVAALLHTTEHALAQMRSKGTGPKFIKAGARILYRRKDILDYLDAHTRQQTGGVA